MDRQKIKIKDSKIIIGSPELRNVIRGLSDGEYAVQISKWKDDRSLRQNALYWKWLSIIGNDLGYHKNELHETFLDKFAPIKTIRNLEGKPVQKPTRSSEMSVEQMSDYMSQIDQLAATQLNMNLPRPEK